MSKAITFRDHADPKKPVINALISIDGKIPVFQRSKNGESWYDLPGGKPEPDDNSFEETILRELFEELGIRARVLSDAPVYKMKHPHLDDSEKVFLTCAHVHGTPTNCLVGEHDALLLLDPEEAVRLLDDRITKEVGRALLSINDMREPPSIAGRRKTTPLTK